MSPAIPSGHSAVMAMRAPTDPADLDYFPTPPWAARAGGELIKRLDPAARSCWEPACGEGHMAHGLADYFAIINQSDVHPYRAGQLVRDFLAPMPTGTVTDWIITNPPFNRAGDFVQLGMDRARRGVAMLLRLVFLEGAKRHFLLYGPNPVTVVAPFAERVPMVKGRWDPEASSATAYAWFIWQKGVPPGPRLEPIPPGTRARLSREGDRARFGVGGPAGLL
jgi:hypothetical protein